MLKSIILGAAITAAVGTATVSAEIAQHGDLFVRFDGGIAPSALPRNTLAPIAVHIEGTINTPTHATPPPIRKLAIALNAAGHLETRGLPVCSRARLRSLNTIQALSACGPALVGAGGLTAVTSFPEQATSLTRAEILLFNTVDHGRSAILAHIFLPNPAPDTRLVTFQIRHRGGVFGTVIQAAVPTTLTRHAHLKSLFLQFQRRYTYRGRQLSYLSASCPTPPGVAVAAFPFARASMTFGDGRTLSSTLVRTCRPR